MKVLFAVSYPLSWSRGGFTVQIKRTQESLEAQGVGVDWVDYTGAIQQNADVIHYWGVPPSKSMWQAAQSRGMKQVVTFLSPKGIINPTGRNYAERLLRNLTIKGLGEFRLFGSMAVGLEAADAFILLNEAEQRYVNFMYGWPNDRCHIIPNGVDDCFFKKTENVKPLGGLFYPSYICPRKNQVEIARIAKREKIPVYFVGGAQGESPEYFEAFKKEIDNQYVFWLGEINPSSELASLYRSALGTFLASDYDNQGLILLESLACGCPVMGPSVDSVKSHFGNQILYCDSAKSENFPEQFRKFFEFCQQGGRQSFITLTWPDIARKIIKVYEDLLEL